MVFPSGDLILNMTDIVCNCHSVILHISYYLSAPQVIVQYPNYSELLCKSMIDLIMPDPLDKTNLCNPCCVQIIL